MNPKVSNVRPLADYCLLLEFANGERRVFDVAPYLSRGVFEKLRDPASFGAVRVVAGSVEWPGQVDLSYDTVYLGSAPA
jgi:hypothetical protein